MQDPGHRDLAQGHQCGGLGPVTGRFGAPGVPAVHRGVGLHPGDLLADVGVGELSGRPRHPDQAVRVGLEVPTGAGCPGQVAHQSPLVGQRHLQHRPPAARFADEVGVRHPRVGDEDLVELRFPGDLMNRPDLDAGLAHREDEKTDAPVFGYVPVGAGHQQAVVGGGGEGGPHLLAVDHPVVTVAVGPGP